MKRGPSLSTNVALLERILDLIPVRVFWKDSESRYVGCNQLFLEHAGLSEKDSIVGKTDFELPWKSYAEQYQQSDRRILKTKKGEHEYEECQLHNNAEKTWFKTTKIPLIHAGGDPVGILGWFQDVSNARQLELELRATREKLTSQRKLGQKTLEDPKDDLLNKAVARLQTILDAADDGIITFNEQGEIQNANLSAERLFGYSQHELYGTKIGRILPRFNLSSEDPKPIKFELIAKKKDRSAFPVECSLNVIAVEEQQTFITIVRDITERKWMEEQLREREYQLRTFLNGSTAMIWWMGPHGKALTFNEAWLEFTGRTLEQEMDVEWAGQSLHPDDRSRCLSTYHRSLVDHKAFRHEYRHLNKYGEYRWFLESGIPQFSRDNRYQGYIGTAVDITDRKNAEDQLYEEKDRLQITLESIGDAVITTDANGIIEYLNPVAEKLTTWTLAEAIGQPISKVFTIVNGEDRQPCPSPVYQCLSEGRVVGLGNHTILTTRSGKEYSIQDSAAPIWNRSRKILGAIVVFSDVTEQRRLAKLLAYQASHDPLTQLANRREFEKRLQRLLENAQKNGTEHVLCYMDLDQFKVINDTCGHMAGDELLRQVARVMKKGIRTRDTLGRLGGDEFGIIMEYCSVEQAERTTESVRDAIGAFRFAWKNKVFNIGVSLGLVAITKNDQTTGDLLMKADSACYAAKRAGRNRTHIYQADDAALAEQQGEMHWVSRINHGLDTNRFCLFFQPIHSFKWPERLNYELLLRLHDTGDEPVAPGAFLPIAQRYGLTTKIDCWVIIKAFTWLNSNPHHVQRLHRCAINLSGYSLGDRDVLDCILRQLDETGLSPDRICFEITETAAIDNLPSASQFIDTLRQRGCRFALDDFGSGLASFAYLKNLPVDYLKIDGDFVKNMVNDPTDLAMVKSINEIGHVMGKETIAESVENDEILDATRNMGVDYFQGFATDRPQPIERMHG